jgi:hypothetical protein
MLKFLETRDEVVDLVHTVAEQPEMSSFKVGVAGSYVTSLNKKGSAIDIILKLKDGADKDLIGDLGINYFVRDYIARAYSNKIHIIWLDLLEADEEALLKFIGTEGVENNPESAYTNIVGEVRWVEDDEEDDEDADDRISSSVVTYDEEEDN